MTFESPYERNKYAEQERPTSPAEIEKLWNEETGYSYLFSESERITNSYLDEDAGLDTGQSLQEGKLTEAALNHLIRGKDSEAYKTGALYGVVNSKEDVKKYKEGLAIAAGLRSLGAFCIFAGSCAVVAIRDYIVSPIEQSIIKYRQNSRNKAYKDVKNLESFRESADALIANIETSHVLIKAIEATYAAFQVNTSQITSNDLQIYARDIGVEESLSEHRIHVLGTWGTETPASSHGLA
jgi:hypothetical protein